MKSRFGRVHSRRRGSAVALALVCVTIVAALGVAFLTITTSASARQMAEVENLRAFYLAEAGLAEAFQALRVGRTGQIGTEEAPAQFGNGLVWVDAVQAEDGQVWLESTGLVGSSSAALSLVVEPVDAPLGFFSDEDLVVDKVVLVDGFNSDERTYDRELREMGALIAYAQDLADRAGQEFLIEHLKANKNNAPHKVATEGKLTPAEEGDLFDTWPKLHAAFEAGFLFQTPPPAPDVTDQEVTELGGAPSVPLAPQAPVGQGPSDAHTLDGGVLGSNGNVVFKRTGDEAAKVYGDVIPGEKGKVKGRKHASIKGETQSREEDVELPPVEVPAIALEDPIRHDELLPLVVSPGIRGFEEIVVAAGAELVLRGPGTIVLGELIVEPGAALTLDTRHGDVELFVTGSMNLQPGSVATTTSYFPEELSVQVAETASAEDGLAVKLDATAQFYGTIYAPSSRVYVGSNFEVFGGVVARKLELGEGAQLHFDNAGFEGTPVPQFVSWKIIAIEKSARERRRSLFAALELDPASVPVLSKAHDLESVDLKVVYRDSSGAKQTYLGPEDAFDWSAVKKVVRAQRVPKRKPKKKKK